MVFGRRDHVHCDLLEGACRFNGCQTTLSPNTLPQECKFCFFINVIDQILVFWESDSLWKLRHVGSRIDVADTAELLLLPDRAIELLAVLCVEADEHPW